MCIYITKQDNMGNCCKAPEKPIGSQTLYLYVRKQNLDSVLQHGYMTLRGLQKLHQIAPIVSTYEDEFFHEVETGPDVEDVSFSTSFARERVLSYINWKEPAQGKVADAIYAMWYPIPSEPSIQRFLSSFLEERVLVSFTVDTRVYDLFHVHECLTPEERNNKKFWVRYWRLFMNKYVHKHSDCVYSTCPGSDFHLKSIPHAYILLPEHVTSIQVQVVSPTSF